MSYQVIEMYGENEPWWFFKGWEDDIVSRHEFVTFEEATIYLHKIMKQLNEDYEQMTFKPNFMVAFWNEDEVRFCEECDDDLQLYRGVLMLKDGEKIVVDGKEQNEKISISGEAKCCKRFG
ncbi:DUF1033 family protein [Vagococcus xieshaowenii]|uniref:DUF1033 family protein n=1 Tax=Vagococcus xieshaowenii TaxID=2562451 RepID=A0AAJ5EGY6_9ENTE|nr:DUF1033 family protein [Vagococcus xieshaowenii]QCA28842.1 DUF1033 family protein [Vagococcus xieshaowenii]TFZ43451.1 DUF1033 family protein [Vagococcus xieshaowenii]